MWQCGIFYTIFFLVIYNLKVTLWGKKYNALIAMKAIAYINII